MLPFTSIGEQQSVDNSAKKENKGLARETYMVYQCSYFFLQKTLGPGPRKIQCFFTY